MATPNDASKTIEGYWKCERRACLYLPLESPISRALHLEVASNVDADKSDPSHRAWQTAAHAEPVMRTVLYSKDEGVVRKKALGVAGKSTPGPQAVERNFGKESVRGDGD